MPSIHEEISNKFNQAYGTVELKIEKYRRVETWSVIIQSLTEQKYDDLSSERNVDYTRLRNLLAEGKWKEADDETLVVLFKAAAQEHEGHLDIKSIETFPCADLRTIDRLWVKYSHGRFGFSVQKRIWESVVRESVGLKPSDYYYGMEFPDRVGWSVNQKWLFESDLTYGENAPEGHLPTYCRLYGHGWQFTRRTISSLASRLVSCNI
jgi:hypothetical protein